MAWNFGDVLDAITEVLPDGHPALIHGKRIVTWQDMHQRSNRLGRALRSNGLEAGAKIAFYMRNRPEYMEALAACFKMRLTHVNVNYRYTPDELLYIFDNSDSEAVLYGAEFRQQIEELRPRLPKVKLWVEIGEGTPLDGSLSYATLATQGDGRNWDEKRSVQDLLFLYTGGTTGMPKGVMWEHEALSEAQLLALRALGPVPESPAELAAHIKANGPGQVMIPACPLMHGTGLFTAMAVLCNGGTIVTLESQSFNADELWAAVTQNKVQYVSIVGDAFAVPMVQALERDPKKYDVSSMEQIVSSGVMWSQEVKERMLVHMPQVVLADSFGSSEAIGFGTSLMTKDAPVETAKFMTNDFCKVFDENDNEIPRGSGTPGFIAFGGPIPLGYYKDDKKTASTFKTINGKRYSIPGDYCLVQPDGALTLLGRGSVCINTAGEKVYPEEVEEVLKTHPCIEDALVVGVEDEKWGQAVVAVVEANTGQSIDEDDIKAHVRKKLAGYKTPKAILTGAPVMRASNGKADYKAVREFAIKQIHG